MADKEIVDYAPHLLTAEKHLKTISHLCLHGALTAAKGEIATVVAELRLLYSALTLMEEKKAADEAARKAGK